MARQRGKLVERFAARQELIEALPVEGTYLHAESRLLIPDQVARNRAEAQLVVQAAVVQVRQLGVVQREPLAHELADVDSDTEVIAQHAFQRADGMRLLG